MKSVKGKFFGIVFDESAIYTDITDAGDDEEPFAGVGGGQGVRGGRILEVCRKVSYLVLFSMNQQFTQTLQTQETRRNPLLVLVDGEEYEEFEYLKSVKGKFFGIVFDESAI